MTFLSPPPTQGIPSAPPLYGCSNGHLVCNACRSTGGEVLHSCMTYLLLKVKKVSSALTVEKRISLADSLLPSLCFLPSCREAPDPALTRYSYHQRPSIKPTLTKESGCTTLLGAGPRTRHAMTCLFRPVRCPKAIFSSSCLYKGPYCTIQVLFCSVEVTPLSSLESWQVPARLPEGYYQLGAWPDHI